MSTTAVPLPPIRKGSMIKLWTGVGLLIALAAGIAWAGTEKLVSAARPPAELLGSNARKGGVHQPASGLQYEVLPQGDGAKPTADDMVLVHYDGKLADGTVFDSSYARGQPVPFPVTGVIPGITEGLQLMQKGSKFRFWIPPELGYGPEGAGDGVIPPNALLVFDVELLEIAPRAAVEAMSGMGNPQHP